MQTGRNDPCPCGSGIKYKKCCLTSGRFEKNDKAQPISAEQQLEIAKSAFEMGDTPGARRSIEPLLRQPRVPIKALALASRIEMKTMNFVKSRDYMHRVLQEDPDNPAYLYNYGTALALSGDLEKAVKAFRHALAVKPDMWFVYHNLGQALRDLGHSVEAVQCYQTAFDKGQLNASTMSQILVNMQLFCTDQHELLFEMHCKLGQKIAASVPADSPRRRSIAARQKIRLGYLSPRFSREIVGYFFKPLFDNHDRSKFELFLYNASPKTDDLTGQFANRADKWIEIGELSDAAVCQKIVDDEIDILIDLAGHAPESRITAVAQKPAPLQISMLDYFDTTGLDAFDYYVTDRFSSPQDSKQKFTEKLLYLDQPRLVYEAADYAPAVKVRTSQDGAIVFGSFNRHHKIVPHVIATWSRLLHAVPDATLLLKSSGFSSADVRKQFLKHFGDRGIAQDRIEFRGASGHQQMLAEYADMDIALDTFPYNGGLTTCEAMWMGTPVITLLGERIISRQTAGMLHTVGLPDFVANSEEEFAQIGRYWSQRRDELNALRLGLRTRMAESPLTDAAKYTADFEANLQNVWSEFLSLHAQDVAKS